MILCKDKCHEQRSFLLLAPLLRLMIDCDCKIRALKQCEIQNRLRINTIYQPTQAQKQGKGPLFHVLLIALTLN